MILILGCLNLIDLLNKVIKLKPKKDSDTEQMILEAAEKLFLEKGFAMTSTTEIAKKAGCNQALVHYYFRTKEKLFQAIFENKVSLLLSTFFQLSEKDIPFEEKLAKIVEAHFEIIRANPRIPFLVINELTTNPARIKKMARKMAMDKSILPKLKEQMEEEIQKGNVREMNPIDLLVTMVSLNVFLFLASPVMKNVLNISDEQFEEIIENRKKENVFIILRSIKP